MYKICLHIENEKMWITVKGMILLEKSFVGAVDRILEGIRIQKRMVLKNISGAAKSILNQKTIVQ